MGLTSTKLKKRAPSAVVCHCENPPSRRGGDEAIYRDRLLRFARNDVMSMRFKNELPSDFSLSGDRQAMEKALAKVKSELGATYSLAIGAKSGQVVSPRRGKGSNTTHLDGNGPEVSKSTKRKRSNDKGTRL